MNRTVEFDEALNAIGDGKRVTCVVDDGAPVVYQVIAEELTINGKIYHIRDFCFSPTQILFGKWEIEEGDAKC